MCRPEYGREGNVRAECFGVSSALRKKQKTAIPERSRDNRFLFSERGQVAILPVQQKTLVAPAAFAELSVLPISSMCVRRDLFAAFAAIIQQETRTYNAVAANG